MDDISENPEQWINLHWKHNHLTQYFASKHGIPIDPNFKDRDLLKPDNNWLDKLNQSDNKLCYICGLSMGMSDDNVCSSILTRSTTAMLVGIPNEIFKENCRHVLESLKSNSQQPILYDDLYRDYIQFQENISPLLYGNSHHLCSVIKRDFPLLNINFKLNNISIENPLVTRNNIKKLLGELLVRKRPKRSITKSSTISHMSRTIQDWRQEIVEPSNYTTKQARLKLANKRYSVLNKHVYTTYSSMVNYDIPQLKLFNYLSVQTIIYIALREVFHIGPLQWIDPIEQLLIKSLTEIQGVTGLSLQSGVYYTNENIPDEILYRFIETLKLSHPELFTNKETQGQYQEFCTFFRHYLNLRTPLYNVGNPIYEDETLYHIFKETTINMIDYMWNIWSHTYSVDEAIIVGNGDIMDTLASGEQLDEYSKKFDGYLEFIKLLQGIRTSYIDEIVEDIVYDTPQEKKEDMVIDGHGDTVKMDDSKELQSMIFMVGDKEIYSNENRG
jgi:hypothetical protein